MVRTNQISATQPRGERREPRAREIRTIGWRNEAMFTTTPKQIARTAFTASLLVLAFVLSSVSFARGKDAMPPGQERKLGGGYQDAAPGGSIPAGTHFVMDQARGRAQSGLSPAPRRRSFESIVGDHNGPTAPR